MVNYTSHTYNTLKINLNCAYRIGHSFGAYVAASYAIAFPFRVSHLILASPVGVPQEPDTPESYNRRRLSFGWRLVRNLVVLLWNAGYTPLSFVRFLGPIGRQPVTAFVNRRFLIGPAVEDTQSMTGDDVLGASAALADQIDKRQLKLPKSDVAEYLVRDFCHLSSIYKNMMDFSIIYAHNLAAVNWLCLIF